MGLQIGVTGPRRRGTAQRLISLGLKMHGANPRYLRPGTHGDISHLDGLVLSGGTHVHPEHYGEEPSVIARYDPHRDAMDLELLRRAEELHLPVLGICRGAQMINIFRGGSLHQNVTPMRIKTRHRPMLLPLQAVQLVQDSRLHSILDRHAVGANRIHSQAIHKLGRGLKVVAMDNDLFVQGIESTEGHWLLGVQWHPEYLLYHGAHRRIFARFVEAASDRKRERLGDETVTR